MNNIIKRILNFAKTDKQTKQKLYSFLLGNVKLMNYPHLFISESELSLLTLTSEGWSFPRAFSFISMACLKNASAGLQITGKKKHYHLTISPFQKHEQEIHVMIKKSTR